MHHLHTSQICEGELEVERCKGVYKISFVDGYFYIGSAYGKGGVAGRWGRHRSGSKSSPTYLQEKAKEFGGWFIGEQNKNIVFTILEEINTIIEAKNREQYWLDKFKSDLKLLNINKLACTPPILRGADNPNYGKKLSEETKRKISESKSGQPSWSKGRTNIYSKETIERLAKNAFGAKLNFELAGEIREKYYNGNCSQKCLCQEYGVSKETITAVVVNKKWKDDSFKFVKRSHTDYCVDQEGKKKKMIERERARLERGERHFNSILTIEQVREIRQLYLAGGWTQSKLAEKIGITRSAVQKVIHNKVWYDPEYTYVSKKTWTTT